jgi:hypothetical protein
MELSVLDYVISDYHIVQILKECDPDDLWYLKSFHDVDEWCSDTFGPQDIWGSDPTSGWKRMRNNYYFLDKQDLMIFVLKWS